MAIEDRSGSGDRGRGPGVRGYPFADPSAAYEGLSDEKKVSPEDRGEDVPFMSARDDAGLDSPGRVLYFCREWVDVQDLNGQWYEGQILELHPVRGAKVHFKGYAAKFDTWLPIGDPRIKPLHTYTPRHPILGRIDPRIGTPVSAKDCRDQWCKARIVDVDFDKQMVRVSYLGYNETFDDWLPIRSYRLAPESRDLVAETSAPSAARSTGVGEAHRTDEYRASQENEVRFQNLLRTKLGCEIVLMDFDGNCLFRSVAHQVYGDARFHPIVREKCVAYMEAESEFFSKFIVGDEADFREYARRMRMDAVWGDHVEIQAISELYRRPIEVYAYSAEPLNTYCRSDAPPIRLSYHFRSHYNSVVNPRTHMTTILRSTPGEFEDDSIRRTIERKRRIEAEKSSTVSDITAAELGKVDEDILHSTIESSRSDFERRDASEHDRAIKESLEEFERLSKAREAAEIEKAAAASVEAAVKETLEATAKAAAEDESRAIAAAVMESLGGASTTGVAAVETVSSRAIGIMVDAGYTLEQCTEAVAMVESIVGTVTSADEMVRYMTNYILEGDVFGMG